MASSLSQPPKGIKYHHTAMSGQGREHEVTPSCPPPLSSTVCGPSIRITDFLRSRAFDLFVDSEMGGGAKERRRRPRYSISPLYSVSNLTVALNLKVSSPVTAFMQCSVVGMCLNSGCFCETLLWCLVPRVPLMSKPLKARATDLQQRQSPGGSGHTTLRTNGIFPPHSAHSPV